MTLKIPAPRLLPMTIATVAALLAVKSGVFLDAALSEGRKPGGGIVATARAAGTEPAGEHVKPAPAPPPEPMAADCPPQISDSEKSILQDLRQRRQQLDALGESLTARESLLAAAEQKVAARVSELQSLQKKLEALDAAQKQKEDAGWQGLVKMYEAMKPRDAAAIFNDLDLPVLLPVLDRMKEAKAAPVLAAMPPERARQVTAELAQLRTRAVTPARPAAPQEK
jgi:flagellar motility protein MotE (MotC chaperone)